MHTPLVPALVITLFAGACAPREQAKDTSSSTQAATAQPAAPPVRGSEAKANNACELVTPAEIARFLNVPAVKKDEINSGKNELTHVDICNWEGGTEGLELRLYRAESADEGASLRAYSSAEGYATGYDGARSSAAQSVAGVGLDAILSPFPDGKGASLAFRTAAGAVALTGSASRNALVAMAKLAASRM